MGKDFHLQVPAPLQPRRGVRVGADLQESVVARGRDAEQFGHAGDVVVGALCRHEFEPAHFGCRAAKYAEAFSRKAMSLACSAIVAAC